MVLRVGQPRDAFTEVKMVDQLKDPLYLVLNHAEDEAWRFETYLLLHAYLGTTLGIRVVQEITRLKFVMFTVPNVTINLYCSDRRLANSLYKWYAKYVRPYRKP